MFGIFTLSQRLEQQEAVQLRVFCLLVTGALWLLVPVVAARSSVLWGRRGCGRLTISRFPLLHLSSGADQWHLLLWLCHVSSFSLLLAVCLSKCCSQWLWIVNISGPFLMAEQETEVPEISEFSYLTGWV